MHGHEHRDHDEAAPQICVLWRGRANNLSAPPSPNLLRWPRATAETLQPQLNQASVKGAHVQTRGYVDLWLDVDRWQGYRLRLGGYVQALPCDHEKLCVTELSPKSHGDN